jgi:hypothetical protein
MGLLENMKEVADLIKKAGDIDLYRKIVESEGEVMELTREKRMLEDRVSELEKLLALQKQMIFKPPFYWQEGDETPYCPACWEARKTAVHLTFDFDNPRRTKWDCKSCQQTYSVEKTGTVPTTGHRGPSGPHSWMGS